MSPSRRDSPRGADHAHSAGRVPGPADPDPGSWKHPIGSVLRSSVRNTSVVLFRASDVSLDISGANLLRSGPPPLDVSFLLVAKLDRPILVWQNLLRVTNPYSTGHLAGVLYVDIPSPARANLAYHRFGKEAF